MEGWSACAIFAAVEYNVIRARQLQILTLLVLVGVVGGCSESPQVAAKPEESSTSVTANSVSSTNKTRAAAEQGNALAEGDSEEPQRRVALKPVVEPPGTKLPGTQPPQVWLSAEHSAMCRVRVGDSLPPMKLPRLAGEETELASLHGSLATVVVFWHEDAWMSRTALSDLQQEIAAKYPAAEVSVVGIAVGTPKKTVDQTVQTAEVKFPQLLDADGKAFGRVGMVLLPRIYVLDAEGKILWFDIEYSESTRREIGWTLAALTKSE